MLSDLYSTAGFSHSRGSASLLQALIGRGTPDVITGLGNLHRACVWESIVFKNGVGVKDSDPSMPSFLRLPPDGQADDNPLVQSPFGISATENPTPDTNTMERTSSSSAGGSSSPSKVGKEKDSPRSLNIRALSHALNQIPSSLTPLFQCAIPLFGLGHSRGLTMYLSYRQALLHPSYPRCEYQAKNSRYICSCRRRCRKSPLPEGLRSVRFLFRSTTWTNSQRRG